MPRPLREYQEDIAAEMLEDLAEVSGIPLLDILASEVEEEVKETEAPEDFRVTDIYEEEGEHSELELGNFQDQDVDDYFDDLFDDIDVDQDSEQDSYGDEKL